MNEIEETQIFRGKYGKARETLRQRDQRKLINKE